MRAEYTIRITDNTGKVSICVYPKNMQMKKHVIIKAALNIARWNILK